MFNHFVFLVGLPGSGKTTYGNSIKLEKSVFIDDIKDFNLITNAAKIFDTIFVSDPKLCDDEIRKLASARITNMYPYVVIEWVFWENSPEKAWNNVVRRNDGRKISKRYIEDLSKKYNPPKIDFKIWES